MSAFFRRYEKWVIGSAGGVAASIIAVKCASPLDPKSPGRDINGGGRGAHLFPPDFAPLTVWDSNWDRYGRESC